MTDNSENASGQTILEHLDELRIRLVWAAIGLLLAVVASFAFTQKLLDILIEPYGEQLQTLSPTEGIQTYFRVALLAGITLAMPWIMYQLWMFISPGLHQNERRYAYIFVPAASILFLLGVAFAWFILLPSAISFLANFMPQIFTAEWTSQEYIGFATSFLLWMGISFQLPLIVYFLSRFGIIDGTTMRVHWRVAIVAIAVIAAIVTPSIDPVTMLLTMLPLTLLYILSIGLASLGHRQFSRAMAVGDDVVDTAATN